jgi:hypothetical protein
MCHVLLTGSILVSFFTQIYSKSSSGSLSRSGFTYFKAIEIFSVIPLKRQKFVIVFFMSVYVRWYVRLFSMYIHTVQHIWRRMKGRCWSLPFCSMYNWYQQIFRLQSFTQFWKEKREILPKNFFKKRDFSYNLSYFYSLRISVSKNWKNVPSEEPIF